MRGSVSFLTSFPLPCAPATPFSLSLHPVSRVHVRHARACGMGSRDVEEQGGVSASARRKARERHEEGQDTQQRQTQDQLSRQTGEEERCAINQRLLVMLSLSDMFHLFEPLGAGPSWPELGQASSIHTGHYTGHHGMCWPLHRALRLWQGLAEDAASSRDMTAVWWLSHYALFLSCTDSSSDASVHQTRQHARRDVGEEGGGGTAVGADQMPCHLYHPDGAQGEGGASWQGRPLALQVPATIVLLQRLVLTEFAVLSRQISSSSSSSPSFASPSFAISDMTTQAQAPRAGGEGSGGHEQGWRVERLVCLAHAACCLAACLARYHHTLYLFFKVTLDVLCCACAALCQCCFVRVRYGW
jgi:hypothetical protein